LWQTCEKQADAGVEACIIAAGVTPTSGARVQVASVLSAVYRLHQLTDIGLVITDEAHHAAGG
jgi:superfamily II DNA or RNA helicase